jgi:hypothetical protein
MEHDFEAWFTAAQPAAACPHHPGRAAAVTCGRCGGFRCDWCVDRDQPSLCEPCAALLAREQLPQLTRSVALKLLLAPLFAAVTAGLLAHRHAEVPAQLTVWAVPVLFAALLLRTQRAVFGWLGVLISLAVLGYQGLNVVDRGELLRLTDVALLAVAPLVALHGCAALSKQQGRMQVLGVAATL